MESLPLTVLDKRPQRAAELVHANHLEKMYVDAYTQLVVVRGANSMLGQSGYYTPQGARWFGSEKFLYDLVDAIGQRAGKIDHEAYKESFDKEGLDKPPIWMNSSSTYKRHIAELMYYDDIERLEARYIRQRSRGALPDMRNIISRSRDLPTELAVVAFTLLGGAYAGYNPQTFTHANIIHLNRRYRLYQQSITSFYRRNRYRDVGPRNYRNIIIENRPYIQRTMEVGKMMVQLRYRNLGVPLDEYSRNHRMGTFYPGNQRYAQMYTLYGRTVVPNLQTNGFDISQEYEAEWRESV